MDEKLKVSARANKDQGSGKIDTVDLQETVHEETVPIVVKSKKEVADMRKSAIEYWRKKDEVELAKIHEELAAAFEGYDLGEEVDAREHNRQSEIK